MMDKKEITRFFDFRQLQIYFRQFWFSLMKHREAVDFIYEKKIWNGFWQYGWTAKILVVIAAVVGLKFLSILLEGFSSANTSTAFSMINSAGNIMGQFASEGYNFLFVGSMKYILMIILEVVIFHVSRRTLSILTGTQSDASFEAFLEAQKRMIKVVIRSYIMEMIAIILIKVAFGLFGIGDFFRPLPIFIIQSYYLGFAVVDNYHEQFGLSIKESVEEMRNYVGVALAVGMFMQLAFIIPVAGTLGGPVIAAVAATLAMYELSDLHRREKQVVEVIDPEEIV